MRRDESPDTAAGDALRVHTAQELRFFLPARRRREWLDVPHDGTASLGHVVESVGVPLPEAGTLLVNGETAEPAHRPRAGDTITILPVRRPQRVESRFALDVHFGTLARYLRLVGVDAVYRNDATDDDLIDRAGKEGRTVLTQDQGLLRRRALPSGAYVRGTRPLEQLADVIERFAPPLRPWTRCTACNGELVATDKDEVSGELRAGTRRCYDVYARCDSCGRIYWRGAHARRIEAVIETAHRAHPELGS